MPVTENLGVCLTVFGLTTLPLPYIILIPALSPVQDSIGQNKIKVHKADKTAKKSDLLISK